MERQKGSRIVLQRYQDELGTKDKELSRLNDKTLKYTQSYSDGYINNRDYKTLMDEVTESKMAVEKEIVNIRKKILESNSPGVDLTKEQLGGAIDILLEETERMDKREVYRN